MSYLRLLRLLRRLLPYIICLLFFIAYGVLSIVRHNHYQSLGYDLGINDQAVWRYSTFQAPLTTIDPYPDKIKLYTHIELVYAYISPFYWIWSSRKMLLLLEVAFVCSGGIALYLLARKKKIKELPSIAILVSYLGFYGVQNALWFDVHSISFGAAFLAWFLYFIDGKKNWATILFFFLAITAKENVALITFFICAVYYIKKRDVTTLFMAIVSVLYLFFVFFIFFPYIIHVPYLYQNHEGLTSSLNPLYLFNTSEKLYTMFYSIFSFGFIPVLFPFSLVPALADLATYFVIGSDLAGAQGMFLQYRITLAPLLAWATVISIKRYNKWLNNNYVGIYLFVCVLIAQYTLHLPLSYLSKSWFWTEPSGAKNIQAIIETGLPETAAVVAQNNIIPHISHRDKIYELYPEIKSFKKISPCGKPTCNWFRWYDNPEFLFVDTSLEWDTRHLLTNRKEFMDGLKNIEKAGIVIPYKKVGNAHLYKVLKNPSEYE